MFCNQKFVAWLDEVSYVDFLFLINTLESQISDFDIMTIIFAYDINHLTMMM